MRVPVVIEDQSLLPAYARPGDAGADLRCTEAFHLAPGERTLVGTGVRLAIPEGYVGLVTPRSGLAARSGLGIVNSPGVIDAGFRGEVQVCLINLDPMTPIEGAAGDRIAQLVVIPFVTASFEAVEVLDETVRGCGGYGSTGTGHVAPHDTGGPDR